MGFRELVVKRSIHCLFMSKEQTIYLLFLLFDLIIGGAISPTLVSLNIGLGSRMYSIQLIVSCIVGIVYSIVATDLKKKKWIFKHFKAIDLGETIFYTVFNFVFLAIYFLGRFDATEDWLRVCKLFFSYSLFLKIVRAIVTVILPSVGDVFEQSLYKNQIDYQNHSNAEGLVANFGAAIGALTAFIIGDMLKDHIWIIFALVVNDWLGLWSRWQFYFNKENYSIIKKNFAKDAAKWKISS